MLLSRTRRDTDYALECWDCSRNKIEELQLQVTAAPGAPKFDAPGGFLFVSGVDLDVRTKVAADLGWKPCLELLEEMHEGDSSLRTSWPCKYWGLERATFLIDGDGILRAIWPKVKVPGHVEAVLEAARGI